MKCRMCNKPKEEHSTNQWDRHAIQTKFWKKVWLSGIITGISLGIIIISLISFFSSLILLFLDSSNKKFMLTNNTLLKISELQLITDLHEKVKALYDSIHDIESIENELERKLKIIKLVNYWFSHGGALPKN